MAVKVLVTGGNGVLGRSVVELLGKSGYIVCTSSKQGSTDSNYKWDISKQTNPSIKYQPSVVVHLAAKRGRYKNDNHTDEMLFDVNVTGTYRVINWCIRNGVKLVILSSGAIVYGEWGKEPKVETDPVKPWSAGTYAVSKWCSEQVSYLAEQAGLMVLILRFSSLYGIGYQSGLIQRLLRFGSSEGFIELNPPFDDCFDLLHVQDAAHAIMLALKNNASGIYNIGCGRLVSIKEIAEICAQNTNSKLNLVDNNNQRPARILNWVSNEKAMKELGYESQVSLENGISEIAMHMNTFTEGNRK